MVSFVSRAALTALVVVAALLLGASWFIGYSVAMILDGYIAGPNGESDWIMSPRRSTSRLPWFI
jgi:hypothetical protein